MKLKPVGTPAHLDESRLAAIARYRRAANFLAAGQIYLMDNALLTQPLRPEHIKPRLLGHWGTAPGINLIYAHLNRLILDTDASILLVTGPGHGAAANLANMYLEGTLTEYFPEFTLDAEGLGRFVRAFSWPGGFSSHLSPRYPGVIHEGGELGYALATAYGTVMDNPDLIAACIIGDGESETGPTAGSWHANKFVNPATDGAVLPILHLNGFKIANPSIPGTMSDEELTALFTGYGHEPYIVDFDAERMDAAMVVAMDWAYERIRSIQAAARSRRAPVRARWPMLIVRTPKGWTGPQAIDGLPVEGTFRAHQVPIRDARDNVDHLHALERWLQSYRVEELFDAQGRPAPDLLATCPQGELRLAMNPHTFGGLRRRRLRLPDIDRYAADVRERGAQLMSSVARTGDYLRDVIRANQEFRNFRIFSPDELESNRLGSVLESTDRQYDWPIPAVATNTSRDGRVTEILSEHVCQGWLQGYLLTGRHGIFPCYEAFLPIVDGMINQYAKFLKTSLEVPWREPVSSLNYLLTSEAWRQEHNGYSHQGPGFINNVLTKKGYTYHMYFPPDANTLLHTMARCLAETDSINLIVAGKQMMPQWLDMAEARAHLLVGASIWDWASTDGGESPDIVLASCGDSVTLETMAAIDLLGEVAPEWRIRMVNIVDLMSVGVPEKYPHGLAQDRFQRIFPLECPVILNFHGYTAAIKQLLWEREEAVRFEINGYREEGTTTTPFDMHVRNRTSRYHLVIQAARRLARIKPATAAHAEAIISDFESRLEHHRIYIRAHGIDAPEVRGWTWRGRSIRLRRPTAETKG